jgi:hypothetical protein
MTAQRITELFAWVAQEADGGEGVCAMSMVIAGREMMMPLVGADCARIEALRPQALAIARKSGRPIRLVRFGTAETLENLQP